MRVRKSFKTISFKRFANAAILPCLFSGVVCSSVSAMPWDTDLFNQQSLQSNEITRSPASGTVPLGHRAFTLSKEEADKNLKNPLAPTLSSMMRGRRLYSANCLTCHGPKGDGKGPVASSLPVPNLLEDFYKKRSEGYIFAVINLGGAVMPRYGYKLSEAEHWDIVNYMKFLQGLKPVPAMKLPE